MLNLDDLGEPGKLIKTSLCLLDSHQYGDAKLALIPQTLHLANRSGIINLYGNEADYFLPLTKTILATKVTSTCVFTSCPLHFAFYQTCNITLNDCATFEIALSEWLMPNDSTCKRRFKGKPLPGVPNIQELTNDGNGNNVVSWYCSGLRKYFPRQFVNFKNIYIFSVDLISRKRPLKFGNLPCSVVLNSSTLYLHSATLWNGSHYISIICHFGTWYVYDGLKEHNVQHSGLSTFTIQPAGYIISHVVYCSKNNL